MALYFISFHHTEFVSVKVGEVYATFDNVKEIIQHLEPKQKDDCLSFECWTKDLFQGLYLTGPPKDYLVFQRNAPLLD